MTDFVGQLAAKISLPDFKKKALTWRREIGDITHIVNIQKSSFNGSDVEKLFYINISIFSTSVYESCWGRSAPLAPTESDGIYRRRIDAFCKLPADWYILRSTSEVSDRQDIVNSCLNESVLPLLANLTNIKSLYAFLKSHDMPKEDYLYKIQLACLAYLVGDKTAGLSLLDSVCEQSKVWRENALLARDRFI